MKLSFASVLLACGAIDSAYAFTGQSNSFRAGTELSASRKPFITGNWKLNPTTYDEAVQLAAGIAAHVGPSSPGDVGLFVPFPFIEAVQKQVGDKVVVGAEVSPRALTTVEK